MYIYIYISVSKSFWVLLRGCFFSWAFNYIWTFINFFLKNKKMCQAITFLANFLSKFLVKLNIKISHFFLFKTSSQL